MCKTSFISTENSTNSIKMKRCSKIYIGVNFLVCIQLEKEEIFSEIYWIFFQFYSKIRINGQLVHDVMMIILTCGDI